MRDAVRAEPAPGREVALWLCAEGGAVGLVREEQLEAPRPGAAYAVHHRHVGCQLGLARNRICALWEREVGDDIVPTQRRAVAAPQSKWRGCREGGRHDHTKSKRLHSYLQAWQPPPACSCVV